MITPTSGQIVDREHLLPVRVYYEDTDFTGVVYHANYLRYFERGRSDFLRLRGVSHTELRGREVPMAFVVRRMEVDFAKAARVDDALVIHTVYEAQKGPRVLIRQWIERGGEIIASAAVEVACIRLDGRPLKPPRDVVAALQL